MLPGSISTPAVFIRESQKTSKLSPNYYGLNCLFIFRKIVLDCLQVNTGEDTGIAFSFEEEFKRYLHQHFRGEPLAGQFLIVRWCDGNSMGCCRMAYNNNLKVCAVDRINGNHGKFSCSIFETTAISRRYVQPMLSQKSMPPVLSLKIKR